MDAFSAVSTVSNTQAKPLPILLIGGTDPSGAGLQVDWKVANALSVEASSIVTAVTAQNTELVLEDGVLPSEQFKAQLIAVEKNIFSVIKVGMLGNETIIEALLNFLEARTKSSTSSTENQLILDPVLMASSGGKLLTDDGISLLVSKLLPLTTLITPNLDELALLTKLPVTNQTEIEYAAKQLLNAGAKAVLVKGGHSDDEQNSTDLFISLSNKFYLQGKRWADRKNVRGTGCALASSITAMISKGYCLNDAVVLSKAILSQGIRDSIKVEGELGNQKKLKFKSYGGCENNESNDGTLDIDLQDFPKLSYLSSLSRSNSLRPNKQANFLSCGSKSLGIYPVVDSVEWIKKLVPLGIETIQLRIKTDKPNLENPAEVEQQIKDAITFCGAYKVRLFINDHWKLAIKYKAYGIHLGQEDLAKLSDNDLQEIADAKCRLGLSTHSFYEVARAHQLKPSYIALGPIFATTSKDMPWIPQGVSAVQMWVKLLGDAYPLVAIGGINTERAKALKATGIGSVAMITSITEADDYKDATQKLLSLWSKE